MKECGRKDWQLYHSYEDKQNWCFVHNEALIQVKSKTCIDYDYYGNETARYDYVGTVCPTYTRKESP